MGGSFHVWAAVVAVGFGRLLLIQGRAPNYPSLQPPSTALRRQHPHN